MLVLSFPDQLIGSSNQALALPMQRAKQSVSVIQLQSSSALLFHRARDHHPIRHAALGHTATSVTSKSVTLSSASTSFTDTHTTHISQISASLQKQGEFR